jgi:hypothetical protein
VRSAPRNGDETPRPLQQAKITEKCRNSAVVLGFTDTAGRVKGGDLGWWQANCLLEIADSDGQHTPRELEIRNLCKGDSECHRIDFDVVLERTSPAYNPRWVKVTYSAYPRDLVLYTHRGGQDEVVCRGTCVTTLPAGEHLLRLGQDETSPLRPTVIQERPLPDSSQGAPVRLDRNAAIEGRYRMNKPALAIGGVLAVVGAVGFYAMLYGLWKEQPTTTKVGAAVAAGGLGLGTPLVFLGMPSASVEVRDTR